MENTHTVRHFLDLRKSCQLRLPQVSIRYSQRAHGDATHYTTSARSPADSQEGGAQVAPPYPPTAGTQGTALPEAAAQTDVITDARLHSAHSPHSALLWTFNKSSFWFLWPAIDLRDSEGSCPEAFRDLLQK